MSPPTVDGKKLFRKMPTKYCCTAVPTVTGTPDAASTCFQRHAYITWPPMTAASDVR